MKLTDQSRMPYGDLHKGEKMHGIPASYLLWSVDQPWATGWEGLREYVEENRELLEREVYEKELERLQSRCGDSR